MHMKTKHIARALTALLALIVSLALCGVALGEDTSRYFSDEAIKIDDPYNLILNRYEPLEITGTGRPGKTIDVFLLINNIDSASNEESLGQLNVSDEGTWSLTLTFTDLQTLTHGSTKSEQGIIFAYEGMTREGVAYEKTYNARAVITVDHTELQGLNVDLLTEGDRVLTGTADAGSTVTIATGGVQTSIQVPEGGAFSYSLSEAAHAGVTWTLTATDIYGGVTDAAVTAEPKRGFVPLTLDGAAAQGSSATVSGTALNGYDIELLVDGNAAATVAVGETANVDMATGAVTVGGGGLSFANLMGEAAETTGSYTFELTGLTDGDHSFGVRYANGYFAEADYAGQATSAALTIDGTAPSLTVAGDLYDYDKSVTFTLDDSAYVTMTVAGETLIDDLYTPMGETTRDVTLRGASSVEFTWRDDAGNEGALSVPVNASNQAYAYLDQPGEQAEMKFNAKTKLEGWLIVAADADPDNLPPVAVNVTMPMMDRLYESEVKLTEQNDAAKTEAPLAAAAEHNVYTEGARVYRVTATADMSDAAEGIGFVSMYLSDNLADAVTYNFVKGGGNILDVVTGFFGEAFSGGIGDMVKNWKFWVVVAAGLLLIALIVILATVPLRKKKKARRNRLEPDTNGVPVGPGGQPPVGGVYPNPGVNPNPGSPQNPNVYPGGNSQNSQNPYNNGGARPNTGNNPYGSNIGGGQNPFQTGGQPSQAINNGVQPMSPKPQTAQNGQGGLGGQAIGGQPNIPWQQNPPQQHTGGPQVMSWRDAQKQNGQPTPATTATPVTASTPTSSATPTTAPSAVPTATPPAHDGTVRIRPKKTLHITETRDFAGVKNERTAELDTVLTIGRTESSNFMVQDETVSTRHAKITLEGGKVYITDTGSTNKTILNGTELKPNERAALPSGATVTVGRTTLVITYDA